MMAKTKIIKSPMKAVEFINTNAITTADQNRQLDEDTNGLYLITSDKKTALVVREAVMQIKLIVHKDPGKFGTLFWAELQPGAKG